MEEKKENNSSSSGFGIFVTAIVLAVLYPPMDSYRYSGQVKTNDSKYFSGWDFIWKITENGFSAFEINITYLIIEITIICIIYFAYIASRK